MTPDYFNMPTNDLLEELRAAMRGDGVPPIDLVVALMGHGIDVERVMDQLSRNEETA